MNRKYDPLSIIAIIGLLFATLTGTVKANTPVEQSPVEAAGIGLEARPIGPDPTGEPSGTVESGSELGSDENSSVVDTLMSTPVDFTLALDDGSAEMDLGIGGTQEMFFLNRFSPATGQFPFLLKEIRVFFSTDGGAKIGDAVTLVVYENTSGNSDPATGAVLRAQISETVKATNIWSIYPLATPIALDGPGDVLIGVVAMEKPGSEYFPAAIDVTQSAGRSWAGWWTASPPTTFTLPPDGLWSLIDTAGFPGNWMIRGYGTTFDRRLYLPVVSR